MQLVQSLIMISNMFLMFTSKEGWWHVITKRGVGRSLVSLLKFQCDMSTACPLTAAMWLEYCEFIA